MITYLNGTLVEKQPTRAVLDVGGVGYELSLPVSSFEKLPSTGDNCLLLTYDHVREDTHQLFGFVTEAERKMFLQLTDVSGIGPKTALSLLSGMTVRDLRAAISGGDAKRISATPGIGKKLAERVVLELKDKITLGEGLDAAAGSSGGPDGSSGARDAVLALVALGYRQDEARKKVMDILKDLPDGNDVEAILKKALAR
jgi:holliday junction DNA helicase RuvA